MPYENILRKLGFFSSFLSKLGAIALFGMMSLTTADVIGRYIFNSPILGAFEITEFLVLILIFSFLGYTQSQKTHVSVDLLVERFPKKHQIVIDLFNHVICFLLMILITWMGYLNALDLMHAGESSPNLAIPHYIFAFFLVFGCAVTSIEFFRDVIRLIGMLKGGGKS
jgi:TRAP-type transport system small permease protein